VRDGGLPPITLHGVRHSSATAALAAGEPLTVVSERLGHASSSITANLYQHVLPSTDERTANAAASRSVRPLAPAIGCGQGQAAKPNAPAVLMQRRCRTHRLGDVGAVRRSTYASPSWATLGPPRPGTGSAGRARQGRSVPSTTVSLGASGLS